jgi:hypothetical protein
VTGGAAPKRKGNAWEREVVGYLRDHGHPAAEGAYGAGRPEDVGDIDGVPDFTIEAKAHKALDLAGWITEAERERLAADERFAAVIAKRRGEPTGAAYVVMTLNTFARLTADREVDQ